MEEQRGERGRALEKDLVMLLAHYAFPSEHWDALRFRNPIERVNKDSNDALNRPGKPGDSIT
jgi:transposase-like protein